MGYFQSSIFGILTIGKEHLPYFDVQQNLKNGNFVVIFQYFCQSICNMSSAMTFSNISYAKYTDRKFLIYIQAHW